VHLVNNVPEIAEIATAASELLVAGSSAAAGKARKLRARKQITNKKVLDGKLRREFMASSGDHGMVGGKKHYAGHHLKDSIGSKME
jgi:hypothetical protein